MDFNSFTEYAFKGVVVILLTVLGWIGVSMNRSLAKTKDDLSAHKLHVSENYAKATSLVRIYELIDVVSSDIKTLLQRRTH